MARRAAPPFRPDHLGSLLRPLNVEVADEIRST